MGYGDADNIDYFVNGSFEDPTGLFFGHLAHAALKAAGDRAAVLSGIEAGLRACMDGAKGRNGECDDGNFREAIAGALGDLDEEHHGNIEAWGCSFLAVVGSLLKAVWATSPPADCYSEAPTPESMQGDDALLLIEKFGNNIVTNFITAADTATGVDNFKAKLTEGVKVSYEEMNAAIAALG